MNPQEHEQHMEAMVAGLQKIMQSQDINEIHQIAQSLLGEEQQEEQSPPEASREEMRGRMVEAVKKQMGE